MSWKAQWDESVAKDRPSRVTYEISAAGSSITTSSMTTSIVKTAASLPGSILASF
jgi:hypothetical protein